MQATCSHRRSSRGLTLVELMLVVLVLAIVGALALPQGGGTASTKLRSAARLLAADLDYARVQTITHSDAPRVVVFDLDANQYHIALASEPDAPLTHPTTGHEYITHFGVGRAHALNGVSLAEHDLDDDMLAFGMYGQLEQSDPATITLSAGSRQITITVDADNGEVAIGEIE